MTSPRVRQTNRALEPTAPSADVGLSGREVSAFLVEGGASSIAHLYLFLSPPSLLLPMLITRMVEKHKEDTASATQAH